MKLTKEQRKEMAHKEYLKIRNSAEKKYLKIINPTWEEYKKIQNPAYEEYQKIINITWEEYKKKIKEIDDEPEEIPEIIEQNGRKYRLVEE